MTTETRTDERTELDQRTKDELTPPCGWHGWLYGSGYTDCKSVASWVLHVLCPSCGPRASFSCDLHVSYDIGECYLCFASCGVDFDLTLLGVEPLR